MELEEYDDRTNLVLRYLEELINFSSYGDCAGLPTNLTKLHRNKVKSQVLQDMLLLFLVGYDTDDCPRPVKTLRKKFSNLHPAPDEISYQITEDLSFFQYNHGIDTEEFIEKYRKKILSHLGNLGDSDIREINEYLLSHECPSLDFAENVNVLEYLKKSLTDKIDALHARSDLFIVSGEPGEGKSIFMKQLVSDFAYDVLERLHKYNISSDEKIHLPFFLEAKSLARQLSPNPEENDFSLFADKEMINHPLYLYTNNAGRDYFSPNYNEYPLIKALQKNIPNTSEEFLWKIFLYCKNDNNERVDNLNCVFFIDAFDECTIDEKIMLKGWINKLRADARFVISSREQHVDDLVQSLKFGTLYRKCGTLDDFSEPVLLEMNFTKEELIHQMPQKLASAWGMNEFVLELKVNQKIDNYRKILTHPVFVGLFCRFLSEGELDIHDTESTGSVDYSSFILGGYTVQHIDFYNKIYINCFSRASLRYDQKNIDISKIEKAFLLTAWYYEYLKIENFERMLHVIDLIHEVNLNEQEKKILVEDLGVMYAVGTDFKWTHKTLRELAIGKLISREKEFLIERESYHRGRYTQIEPCICLTYLVEKNLSETLPTLHGILDVLLELGDHAIRTIINDLFFTKLISFTDFEINSNCPIKNELISRILMSKAQGQKGNFYDIEFPNSAFKNLSTNALNFAILNLQYIQGDKSFSNIHTASLSDIDKKYGIFSMVDYAYWHFASSNASGEVLPIPDGNLIYIRNCIGARGLRRSSSVRYLLRFMRMNLPPQEISDIFVKRKWFDRIIRIVGADFSDEFDKLSFFINTRIELRNILRGRIERNSERYLRLSIIRTKEFRDILLLFAIEELRLDPIAVRRNIQLFGEDKGIEAFLDSVTADIQLWPEEL